MYLYFHFKRFALHCLHFVIIFVLSVFQCKKLSFSIQFFTSLMYFYFLLYALVDIVLSVRCKEVCFSGDFDKYTCYFANICIVLVYGLHLGTCLQTKALLSSWCWYILQSGSFFFRDLSCTDVFRFFWGFFVFLIVRFLLNIFASFYSINTRFFRNIRFNDIFS